MHRTHLDMLQSATKGRGYPALLLNHDFEDGVYLINNRQPSRTEAGG